MKQLIVGFAIAAGAIASAQSQSPASTAAARPAITASADLIDAQGRRAGEARLQQTPHGVLIRLDLTNATPGVHGLHIHELGRCDRPSFESAAGHFNPTGRQHGFLNPRGPHAGDLPNIEIPATGRLLVEHFARDITLHSGAGSLLDSDGSAIVIHSGTDDYMTDPSGHSGERLACGQLLRPDSSTR